MNNSIRISCDLENLQEIRNFVREFLMPYALSENEVNLIVLAVDEISANLIIHANKKDNSKYIYLTITKQQDSFLFELSDWGVYFDGNKHNEPNIEDFISRGKKGGIGLALVKRIMDKVEFTTDKKGMNICRLQISI